MLLGGLQLVPRIRANRRRHRLIGRTFLGFGTVAFVCTAIPLAITTPDGNLTRFGVLIPALLWPVLAVIGWRAIRTGDVVRHREWMVRLYAVTFFALTARMVTPLLLLAQAPVMQSRYDGDVQAAVSASIRAGDEAMAVGGPDEAVSALAPILTTLAPGVGSIARTARSGLGPAPREGAPCVGDC